MRFRMLDRIVHLEPGVRLTAVKTLRADEDYLKDHFPRFPVMPGVLMLEAMFQAAMWLVRASEDFANSVVLLKEVRSVKFADFVEPGETLQVEAEILKREPQIHLIKTQGTVNGQVAVGGRLVLERFRLADQQRERSTHDPFIARCMRREFEQLCRKETDHAA
jgi:3-hydroxyacyl-[acyl-carrier-protein] dehydratase